MNYSLYEKLKKKITEKEYYEDIPDSLWQIFEDSIERLTPSDYKNCKIGLFNIPCNGFGDVITCQIFYDYLVQWYPGINVTIYTTKKDNNFNEKFIFSTKNALIKVKKPDWIKT